MLWPAALRPAFLAGVGAPGYNDGTAAIEIALARRPQPFEGTELLG
jgi:hypothetical protein